jgi:hypothetical protein
MKGAPLTLHVAAAQFPPLQATPAALCSLN